jgi:hypothetical protein
LSTYPDPQWPKYIESPKVNVDKHDAGGANGVITGPRLNADIEAWSLIMGVVVVLMMFERMEQAEPTGSSIPSM